MNSSSLTRHSIDAISSVNLDFHENTYVFFYERDTQYALFSVLRELINGQLEVPGPGGNRDKNWME